MSTKANSNALRFGQRTELNQPPVSTELRNRVRYRLSADALFTWQGAQNRRLHGKGFTRDISLTGVFVYTSTCPPVGATVRLEVFLSAAFGAAGKKVGIRTEATVIRIDHSATSEGFAAVSQDFTLLFGRDGRNQFCVSSRERTQSGDEEKRRAEIVM